MEENKVMSREEINEQFNELLKGDFTVLLEKVPNLKTQYDGWNAWLISSNMGALKKVGLRPSRKIKVFNGSLECRFMKYEMYKGTKKIHKMIKNED